MLLLALSTTISWFKKIYKSLVYFNCDSAHPGGHIDFWGVIFMESLIKSSDVINNWFLKLIYSIWWVIWEILEIYYHFPQSLAAILNFSLLSRNIKNVPLWFCFVLSKEELCQVSCLYSKMQLMTKNVSLRRSLSSMFPFCR